MRAKSECGRDELCRGSGTPKEALSALCSPFWGVVVPMGSPLGRV